MADPSDEEPPRVYMPASGARRNPKKLQNIGIGQFRRQGVAHHFQSGSATALLNQKIADKRSEAWLGRMPSTAPADASESKAKGKGKGNGKSETVIKVGENVAATPVEATVQRAPESSSTAPASKDVWKGQNQATVDHGATQKSTLGGSSIGSKAPPLRKLDHIATTSSGRFKADSGTWGRRAVENAKKAAPKATTATYHTTAMTMGAVDGVLTTNPEPRQCLPAPEPFFHRSNVQPAVVPTKIARKSSMKAKSSKNLQTTMWSDSSEGEADDQDDNDEFLFSPWSIEANAKRSRRRTNTRSSANRDPISRKKDPRVLSTPQRKTVRFASAVSTTESSKIIDSVVSNESFKPTQKQKHKQTSHTTRTFNLPKNTNITNNNKSDTPIQSPSPSKENLDPGELSDDEASELHDTKPATAAAAATVSTTSTIKSTPSSILKNPLERPRKKGVARAPLPKRARNDDIKTSQTSPPQSKKSKTTVETSAVHVSERRNLPQRRKKGVTRPVQKKEEAESDFLEKIVYH